YTPQNFNDSNFNIRLPLVSPFWADVDIEHSEGLNGTIVYRLVDDKRLDHKILNRASQDVKTYFKEESEFSAKIVLIVTWYEVGFYGALMDGQLKRNTFQTVLISDGQHSYAIFNYKKISWTTGTSGGGGDELTGLSTLDGKPAV
ncbi:TECTA-like protein, partial [Mya arenaria]